MRNRIGAFFRVAFAWRSLRWRIAALAAASATVVAVVLGVVVHQQSYARSVLEGEYLAGEALNSAEGTYRATGQPAGSTATGTVVSTGVPRPLLDAIHGSDHVVGTWFDTTQPGRPRMWAGHYLDGRLIAVRVELEETFDRLHDQDVFVVEATVGTLVVVFVAVALVSELITRRLRRVARTASRIAEGDLTARIGARPGDEIADLGSAVDSMAGALHRRLLTEQRFTADVAHELRTPLTGLVTSAELLPEGEATVLVRDRVTVLRSLVEDLLEISRLDAGVERAELTPVPLGELVAEAVSRTGLPIVAETTGARLVRTDPRRAERIVANLVHNAVRHGGPPVEVTVTGPAVRVRDHGPGFPEALISEGPQRFRTGAAERGRGQGLGLTIAAGQAEVIGAELTFSNAADGGAVATVIFPAVE
ncbi:sensor histidine kinase [Amycolatopsis jiangsuensis]|uniref:histidine kinase n=1 Tax=Amycolatopsis jiangsuensis TaxID=1181879 RepID=A0A840J7T9_9PSEU|nr:HAMP domain-containing sensor histidine kinase [Amycolatopsis jiangsuensis]MBB4689524.1 signal transduction histidine kinase [Amycolatopsis jiangsuensis]